jgi:glycerol-3-phosphate dehydrogenase subunit C
VSDLLEVELLRGSLDHCVKCTICETACPVSNVSPLFPGPRTWGPQSERYRVSGEPSVEPSARGVLER